MPCGHLVERCGLCIDDTDFCTALPGIQRDGCGRLNRQGASQDEHEFAFLSPCEAGVERVGIEGFAVEDNIGFDDASAVAVWDFIFHDNGGNFVVPEGFVAFETVMI